MAIVHSARARTVRARAPLRLGLAGGGTDIVAYSTLRGGAVLNVTIDRFAFAHLSLNENEKVSFEAADLGLVSRGRVGEDFTVDSGLALHKGVYDRLVSDFFHGNPPSVSLSTTVDAPRGSGLGSSSALCVAIIAAFTAAFDLPLGTYDIANLAYKIERLDLGFAGGMQDQYAAAFGGFNFMQFKSAENVIVNPLRVKFSYARELESSIVVAFTGQSRDSAQIIEKQVSAVVAMEGETLSRLDQIKRDAFDMKDALSRGDLQLVAKVLDGSWSRKRLLTQEITNERLDRIYQIAMRSGAIAGKVSGAGGGGFFMFIAAPEQRLALIRALTEVDVMATPVYFTNEGVEAWAIN